MDNPGATIAAINPQAQSHSPAALNTATTTPASARFFAVPELVDMVLKNLTARENIAVQRVNSTFCDLVKQASSLQKQLYFPIRDKFNGHFTWCGEAGGGSKTVVKISPYPDRQSCTIQEFYECGIMVSEYAADLRFCASAGRIFDSFLYGIHALSKPAMLGVCLETTPKEIQEDVLANPPRTVCIVLSWFDVTGIRGKNEKFRMRVRAQMDPSKPDKWQSLVHQLIIRAPLICEIFDYSTRQLPEGPVTFIRPRCDYPWVARPLLLEDPVYRFVMC